VKRCSIISLILSLTLNQSTYALATCGQWSETLPSDPGPQEGSGNCSTSADAGTADGSYGPGNNISAANGALDVVGCSDGPYPPPNSNLRGGQPYWFGPKPFGIHSGQWYPLFSIRLNDFWAIDIFTPIGASDSTQLLWIDVYQKVHFTRCSILTADCATLNTPPWIDQTYPAAFGAFLADSVAGTSASPLCRGSAERTAVRWRRLRLPVREWQLGKNYRLHWGRPS
jgi:hypothetical protein